MKHPLRFGFAIIAAGAVAAWTSPATHARAADGDTIALTGTATITSDGAGDLPDVLSASEKHPSVDLVLGTGGFGFASSICEGASTDDGVGACAVTANGGFSNIVCGTGTASGTANVTGVDSGTVTFTIVFVGGQGVLLGAGLNDGGTFVGAVELTANGVPADGPLDCADGFTITAVVAGT